MDESLDDTDRPYQTDVCPPMDLARELHNSSILFVTSNDIERDALLSALRAFDANMERKVIGGLERLRVGTLNGYPVCLLSAERGSIGKASVGMLLPDVLATLSPRLVLLSGFCYANPAKTKLHEVIVTNRVVALADFIAREGALQLRSKPALASSVDDAHLQALLAAVSPSFRKQIKDRQMSSGLVTGTVYSGEVFSDDKDFAAEMFKTDESAAGGDMEGRPVASQCNQREIPWLFVKSPSDIGGGTGGTEHAQHYSANVAAIASCELAREFIRTSGLQVRDEFLKFLKSEGPDAAVDLFDGVVIKELRDAGSHAEKIGAFVEKCSLSGPYDKDFQQHLAAVLKEMAENSSKHGNAGRVQLRAGPSGIAIDSNGVFFNPLEEFVKLKSSPGGGQRELTSFLDTYGSGGSGLVEVSWRAETSSQSLAIKFTAMGEDVGKTYFCTLLLTPENICDYAYQPKALTGLKSCREVWLVATPLHTSFSDGMLLSNLCQKIPKTVERIRIRGLPRRYAENFKAMFFAADDRVVIDL